MIVQTLKLPAPDSGFNLLHAIAIGYQKMDRKTVIILPTDKERLFYAKRLLDSSITLMASSKLNLVPGKLRAQLSKFDCVLVHDIKTSRTSEGNLWDLLIHEFHASSTVTTLIGSDTE